MPENAKEQIGKRVQMTFVRSSFNTSFQKKDSGRSERQSRKGIATPRVPRVPAFRLAAQGVWAVSPASGKGRGIAPDAGR